jgi:hypothetical protein
MEDSPAQQPGHQQDNREPYQHGETSNERASVTTGTPTIALRPTGVCDPIHMAGAAPANFLPRVGIHVTASAN